MGGTHSAVNLKPFLNLLRLILKSQVSVVDPSIRKSDLNDLSSFYLSGHSSWLFSYIHALYSVTLQFLLLQSGVSSDVLNLGWLSNSMWQRWQLAGFQPCLCFLILSSSPFYMYFSWALSCTWHYKYWQEKILIIL